MVTGIDVVADIVANLPNIFFKFVYALFITLGRAGRFKNSNLNNSRRVSVSFL